MFVADLFEEVQRRVVAILPGRFHPFHKGHASMYNALVSRYGRDNVWIATSNKVELPKSPFTFSEKLQMMQLAGIPADRVIETKNPYAVPELTQHFNPASTVLIFAVSKKDMDEDPRFSFKPKKDGSAGYLQPLPPTVADADSMDTHGYITTVPTLDFTVLAAPMRSATQVRADYAQADDEKRKAIIKDLFGGYNNEVKAIMDNKLASGPVTEAVAVEPDPTGYSKDLLTTPAGTVVIDTKGDLDWSKIGQALPNLDRLDPHELGQSDSDMVVVPPNADELQKLITALNRLGVTYKVIGGTTAHPEIHNESVTEGWKGKLASAALALSTAAGPAQANDLSALITLMRSADSISRISKDGIKAEIGQEIDNQLRTDSSSQNSTWQGKRKQSSPTAPHLDFSKQRLGNQPPRVSEGVGRIVPGVNTTADVGPNELIKQAKKFGNRVNKDGRPPEAKTNGVIKAYNLGIAESLYNINNDDPMTQSEVHVQGVGVYTIASLHRNLAAKFKDLAERIASMDPEQAQQAKYLLTKSALPAMLTALDQAYQDLKAKRKKGGIGSRGITL